MLAAENSSVDGHLSASTPRRRGMDCKSNNNANRKLIQACLPFKRLNTEPKENQPPKRPCANGCPEVTNRQTENELSPLSERSRPPLVNGRGPLDGFLRRKHPASSDANMIIDLTEDKSSSPVKCLVSPPPTSPCPPTKDKHHCKDRTSNPGKCISVNNAAKTCTVDCVITDEEEKEKENNRAQSDSQLDATQDHDSESEEQNESINVSSLGNGSTQSPSSVSSMSESSPDKAKTDDSTPIEAQTTPKIPAEQKKLKRCSLKSVQVQEERLRLRQEKERQKEEVKAAKQRQKEEARKLKEEKEREKREKKEKEEKEKAERLKAKEDLRKSKLEAKLEEKRKKEEEKRVKDEEKRLKEEKDRLKAEKAEITRFLQKSKIQQTPKTLAAACGKFAPFEIKENMSLAPLTRVQCEESVLEKLDLCLLQPAENSNGLSDWIKQKPRRSGPIRTRQARSLRDCVIVEESKPENIPDQKCYGAMKLLQFHENYRPAYWGTWSKKSSHISPRCPFRQDMDIFDYEVDSDEEWEEDEPGESLSHSEGEDEDGGDDEEDDDDGFFVPHGYLSDDEGALEEEEGGDLEKQKMRQTLKAREWDELMSSKKMKVLEPVVRGCIWEGEGPGLEALQLHAVCLVEPLPTADSSPSPEELLQKGLREEQLLGQLLPLLHGNPNSSKVIINEFQEFHRRQNSSSLSDPSSPQSSAENIPTRIQLKRLIKKNAVYEKRSSFRRCCWYVHTEVLSQFCLEHLPVPCQWTHVTMGAREESREEAQAATGSRGNSPTAPHTSAVHSSHNKRKSTGSLPITKFMKRFTSSEQTEADGFQADTEEDCNEDCVIISTQSGTKREDPSEGDGLMEVTPSASDAVSSA
ncbi:chromatin assembly factor 1 subunit A [Nematolebias whitei]|uniref:chromatin assembly factor 1 subunit A n=1 Tax=Nematolebias whitei TaxID=451745 RepID=UPI001896CF8D|nr:chromatin assembly factor 1 subunit A [Nematolebias whitei]